MSIEITATDARRLRAHAQLLAGSDLTPAEVVARAVALQGQDLPAVLRAIGIRSSSSLDDVRAAFDAGLLVRSWPVRGTLFATTPEWLGAILHFTGERMHRSTITRRAQLGLEDHIIDRARDVVLGLLAERGRTRSEVLEAWDAAGISPKGGWGYHLLLHFALAGLVQWGPFQGDEQLLVRSTAVTPSDPDAALTSIVRSLVYARGPLTDSDLAWWTKLPKTELRRAAARIEDLVKVQVDGAEMWMIGEPSFDLRSSGVLLVPGFDEWILGYADRSLVASPAMFDAMVPGGNGVFRPGILVDGVVVGTWRFPARGKQVVLDMIEPVSAATQKRIDRALRDWPYDG